MSIGERITELRKERHLSQGQLAAALHISRQAVSKWENDLSSPDTENLILLSEVLDTEVEFLATGRTPASEETPIVLNVVQKVEKTVEKVVEKPVLKRVIRIKYLRNPIEFLLVSLISFLLGFLLGRLVL